MQLPPSKLTAHIQRARRREQSKARERAISNKRQKWHLNQLHTSYPLRKISDFTATVFVLRLKSMLMLLFSNQTTRQKSNLRSANQLILVLQFTPQTSASGFLTSFIQDRQPCLPSLSLGPLNSSQCQVFASVYSRITKKTIVHKNPSHSNPSSSAIKENKMDVVALGNYK